MYVTSQSTHQCCMATVHGLHYYLKIVKIAVRYLWSNNIRNWVRYFLLLVSLFLCALLLTVVGLLCIRLLFLSVLLYCVCTAVLHTSVAGLLARSQYPDGPVTGHFGTRFSWFPCV